MLHYTIVCDTKLKTFFFTHTPLHEIVLVFTQQILKRLLQTFPRFRFPILKIDSFRFCSFVFLSEVRLSPTSMLATGTYNGRVKLLDMATGTVRWDMQRLTGGSVKCVAMSPDGSLVVSVSESEESWTIHESVSGAMLLTGTKHDATGTCICKMNRSGRVHFDAACPTRAHTEGVCVVQFSPCGQRLATGGQDGAVIMWNALTGRAEWATRRPTPHEEVRWRFRVNTLTFSADGVRLATGCRDGPIRIWNARTGDLLHSMVHAPGITVECLQFSPTAVNILTSVGQSGTVRQWDTTTGEMKWIYGGNNFAVYSPDGLSIATSGGPLNRYVVLRDAITGDEQDRVAVSNTHHVRSAAFSVDGSRLIVRDDDKLSVWDALTCVFIKNVQVEGVSCASSGRDWVSDTARAMAFSMGYHSRLGTASQLLGLDKELLRMIIERTM
jgi:WD40 repeat protein